LINLGYLNIPATLVKIGGIALAIMILLYLVMVFLLSLVPGNL
jgi:hypothetical protein